MLGTAATVQTFNRSNMGQAASVADLFANDPFFKPKCEKVWRGEKNLYHGGSRRNREENPGPCFQVRDDLEI
jgi:hypothetical protein